MREKGEAAMFQGTQTKREFLLVGGRGFGDGFSESKEIYGGWE